MLTLKQKHSFFTKIISIMIIMIFSTVYGNAVEVNASITNGNNDAEEASNGGMSFRSSDLELITENTSKQ